MQNLTKMENIRLALISENAKQFNDTKNSIIEKIIEMTSEARRFNDKR